MEHYGYEPGVWHEELVGVVHRYPKTPEAYSARVAQLAGFTQGAREAGTLTRKDVPNGWAGRKAEIEAIRRNSHTAAERLAQHFDPPTPDRTRDDQYAEVAMTFLFSVVLDPTQTMRRRLQAAKVALPYVLAKPARVVVGRDEGGAVGFLERLAASLRTPPGAMSFEE